jgi:hypothetical protein
MRVAVLAGVEGGVVEVQCPECLLISTVADLGATSWDCACGCSYSLRHCSACGVVSHVFSLLKNGETWNCVWCKAANTGHARRNDPATATLSDLGAGMARQGLTLARRTRTGPGRDTQPMLIVTTNEVPGHRIVGVHGEWTRSSPETQGCSLPTYPAGGRIRQLLVAVATRRPAASVISAEARATRRPGLITRPVATSVPLARVTGRR